MKWNFTRVEIHNFLYLCIWIFANSLWHIEAAVWMSEWFSGRAVVWSFGRFGWLI